MSTISQPVSPPQPVEGSRNAALINGRFHRELRNYTSAVTLHLVVCVIALLMSLPFVWMLLTSVKPLAEVGGEDWLPTHWQWHNYADVFDAANPDPNRRGIPFARFYINSLFVASWVTALQVLTSAMAAFAFSRLRWTGRERVFFLYLATMMLPGLVMMIPNYQIMISLHLVDTFTGLILPSAFGAFGTFLMRQFMLTIPLAIDEAAEIDGAGPWRLFWDVIMPLARPGLITLTIFTFIGNYNSFLWPLIMLRNPARYTLPVGLMFFDSTRGQSTHLVMAAVTMSVIPMILIFVVLQKYLVKGIQLGAVKG